jgi:hypothetical protein
MVTVLVIGGASIADAQSSFGIMPVALVGDRTPIGGTFARFEDRPNLNEAGDLIFSAEVEGGNAPRGLFFFSKGAITKAVAAGDPTPIGGTFESFEVGRPWGAKSGAAAFNAAVTGGSAPRGVFLFSKGTVTKVIAEGEPAPPGGKFGGVGAERPSVNDAGVVAFKTHVNGGPVTAAIFLFSRGTLTKIVAEGDPAPIGGKVGRQYGRPIINAAGDVAFAASLVGGPASNAIFLASKGKLTSLVRVGDPAPGTGGARFQTFKDVSLGDRGDVSFRAYLEGGPTVEGFFLASRAGIVKLAASGDVMPDGTVWDVASGRPAPNKHGAVVFQGKLKEGAGIYLMDGGKIMKVVAEGDPTPAGGVFASLTKGFLSDAGAVAFRAGITGGRAPEGLFVARRP